MIEDPELSRALAQLSQTLNFEDRKRLADLAMADTPLSDYPEDWRDFVEGYLEQ